MREYEIAELAVQAALDAGARYADVRVMHRDQQMLSARNGDIEAVMSSADSGIGVRALVGSGWGFYATADLDDAIHPAPGGELSDLLLPLRRVPIVHDVRCAKIHGACRFSVAR